MKSPARIKNVPRCFPGAKPGQSQALVDIRHSSTLVGQWVRFGIPGHKFVFCMLFPRVVCTGFLLWHGKRNCLPSSDVPFAHGFTDHAKGMLGSAWKLATSELEPKYWGCIEPVEPGTVYGELKTQNGGHRGDLKPFPMDNPVYSCSHIQRSRYLLHFGAIPFGYFPWLPPTTSFFVPSPQTLNFPSFYPTLPCILHITFSHPRPPY